MRLDSSLEVVTFSKNTKEAKIFAFLVFALTSAHYYAIENPIVFVFYLVSYYIYKFGHSEPLDYFWANEDGIEFFSMDKEIISVPWKKIDQITFNSRVHDDDQDCICFKLSFRLNEIPLNLSSFSVLKTQLKLSVNAREKPKFNQIKALKIRFENSGINTH